MSRKKKAQDPTGIDREVEVKTTQRMSLIGGCLDNDVDDDLGGGCDDYGSIQLTRHRLVSETWFQEIVEELRQARSHGKKQSRVILDNMKTGVGALDTLIEQVYLVGQGNKPTAELIEAMEAAKKAMT